MKFILMGVISILVLQGCSALVSGSHEDFSIPGCEKSWVTIDKTKTLKSLKSLIVNNCTVLYEKNWRLKDKRFKRADKNIDECKKAWSKLEAANQMYNVKFIVTHNCPVLYRKGWIIPPN